MDETSKNKLPISALDEEKPKEADMISSLPDELLCHILSFLGTNDAATTSVLSTRWRSLWTKVCAINIRDDWPCFYKTTFAHVLRKVLAQRKTKWIKRLCLLTYYKHCQPHFVTTLVSNAVSQNIEELDLSYFYMEVTLPATLFICQTITIMKLGGTLNLEIPSFVHLPLLKVLHLYELHHVDDDSIMRLFSGCIVLEELIYEEYIFTRSESFMIHVPSLKKLHILSNGEIFKLDTPSLEYLKLEEARATSYLVSNMDNLVEAHIDICFSNVEKDLSNLFNGIRKTKFLSLSASTIKVLVKSDLQFLEFQNLVRLQLEVKNSSDLYFLVDRFLEKSPKLEILDVEQANDQNGETEWSHITMDKGFLQSLKFILKSKRVLKRITIHITNWLKPLKKIRGAMSKLCAPPPSA